MIRPLLVGLTLSLLTLSACGQAPIRVEAAKPVIVTKTVWTPIPAQFTAPCQAATAEADALKTNGALLAAWQHDSTALTACAAQIDGINAIQATRQ